MTGSTIATLVGKVMASGPYARAHEYGRDPVHSSRGKKFYTIPTRHALTRAGVLRKRITEYRDHTKVRRNKETGVMSQGASKSFGFIRVGRGKSRLLFVEHKRKGKFNVLFNLYRFPTKPIKPRLNLRKNARAQVPKMREGLIAAIQEAFR